MYIKKSLQTYLKDISARKPSPGGGSVAALMGATGASLLLMVAEFSSKNKATSVLMKDAKKLKKDLSKLVDIDVQEYKKVSLAYKKPTRTAAQIISRKKAIQKALISALKVSENTCQLCFVGAKLSKDLSEFGNVNLITDTAISLLLFEAGFRSSFYNIKINLKYLKTAKLSNVKLKEYEKKMDKLKDLKKETLKEIDKKL
jgi:glutamate formiminotransferase/formiminotetrahydrofolate cyclodeaminase